MKKQTPIKICKKHKEPMSQFIEDNGKITHYCMWCNLDENTPKERADTK